MSIELKIKAKHLALEPKIIKTEEKKLEKQIQYLQTKKVGDKVDVDIYPLTSKLWKLRNHRKTDVKFESRATNLARTYLAGKPYSHSEKKRKADKEYDFENKIIPRIVAMVKKYGNSSQALVTDKTIIEWSKL